MSSQTPTRTQELDARAEPHWQRYFATRSQADRNRVAECYLPYLAWMAARFRLPSDLGMDQADLQQCGLFGLLQAVEKFDPGKATAFCSYASLRIRGAMVDGLRDLDHLSRSHRADVQEGDPDGRRAFHFSALDRHDLAETFAASVPDKDFRGVDQRDNWRDVLRQLPFHDKKHRVRLLCIVDGLYRRQRTMAEVAAELGISEPRVSQMHSQLLQTLREQQTTSAAGIPQRPEVSPHPHSLRKSRILPMNTSSPLPAARANVPATPISAADFLAKLQVAEIEQEILRHESELRAWRALLGVAQARDATSDKPARVRRHSGEGTVCQQVEELLRSRGPMSSRDIIAALERPASTIHTLLSKRRGETFIQTTGGLWEPVRREVAASA